MQFREQNNKIQILSYEGYDKEARRSRVRMLGSIDKHSLTITSDLKNKLTVEQLGELTAYIEERRSKLKTEIASSNVLIVAGAMKRAAAALDNNQQIDKATAREIWSNMDELRRAMGRAGYPRTAFRQPKEMPTDPRQCSLLDDDKRSASVFSDAAAAAGVGSDPVDVA